MPNSDPIIVTQQFLISCEKNTSSALQDKLQSRLSQLQTFLASQERFNQAIQTAVTQIASGQTLCPQKSIPELREFFRKTRYLETDLSYLKLVKELPNIDLIFDKILSRRIGSRC